MLLNNQEETFVFILSLTNFCNNNPEQNRVDNHL